MVGIPVYAGRVPAMAVERIRRFKGEGTAAVAVALYGTEIMMMRCWSCPTC